jgi:hypothetical protein
MQKVLRTQHLSATVIDLIEETKEYCFLVTPYFKPWPHLDRALASARKRKTRITFIVRWQADNFAQMVKQVKAYEAELIALPRLHTKLYLNEHSAVVSSMNLCDSSIANNFELGVLWTDRRSVRELKQSILDNELLIADRAVYAPGWFSAEEEAMAGKMAEFEQGLDGKGCCVLCGTHVGLDPVRTIASVYRVRCKPCWSQDMYPEHPHRCVIRFCHLCGEGHESTLNEPFHTGCRTQLAEFLEWQQGPAGKYQFPAVG